MEQLVEMKDPKGLEASFPLHNLLSGWYFRVREVSAGAYVAEGTDLWGHKVSHQGTDSRAVLAQCVSSARGLGVRARGVGFCI